MTKSYLVIAAATVFAFPLTAAASLVKKTATNTNGQLYDFSTVCQDDNTDGLPQCEILESTGLALVSSGWTWTEIVGVPDIGGISAGSGHRNGNDVYRWTTPSWYDFRPNAWYGSRWTLATAGDSESLDVAPEPDSIG